MRAATAPGAEKNTPAAISASAGMSHL